MKKRNYFIWGLLFGAISGIAVAIILPNFLRYTTTPNFKSEGKINLGAIFTCQVAYFGETNTYASGENCFELLAWDPAGDNLYAYYCGDDVIENRKGDACPVPDIQIGANYTGFTIMAVGNIDNDDECDVWTMNDAKNLVNVVSDASD